MNKRLISRLMHERVTGLRSSDVYFFRDDFEHILTGVVFEYVPSGLYIWNFRFPLFDFFGPHLTFSKRLQERPFIGKGEMAEAAIVDFVMASPEVQQTFAAKLPMGLQEFFGQSLLDFDPRRNPRFQFIQAAALVLLGQDLRAAQLLNEIPINLNPKHIPYWNQLSKSLQQGHEAALLLLENVRKENLRTLGVI